VTGETRRLLMSPPDVGPAEEEAVLRAIRSGWVAPTGPEVTAFEEEMAERCGVGHAVAMVSGTAALHLAIEGVGAGSGCVVIVPTMTFVASANAVVYSGARPVFVDVGPDGNLDPDLLSEAITALRAEGETVGAVMSVDLLGRCADYDALPAVCEQHEVPLVEDAAEALGASFTGKHAAGPAGSFGRVASLSFNGNKIMTTSGGGMLLSNSHEIADRCRYLATQARQPVPHYEHTEIGYNYRLSNILAALGRAQLCRLDDMIARRRQLREGYRKAFASVTGVRILGGDDEGANCWLTAIVVDPVAAGWCAADLGAHLARHSVETRAVWKPMHLQPVFSGAQAALSGAAERLFQQGLALPSGSALDEAQAAHVIGLIRQFLEGR
jgi:dTDP-4-amino-4,6-dideoxygalactose transaminase